MKKILDALKMASKIYPKILKYKLFGTPVPIMVAFGVINKCNLKCDYCFARPEVRINKELPTKKLLEYIDQFIDLGTLIFDLQGGEPTLHPDIGVLISHIVERGAVCTMATNGFRVDKNLEYLKKCHSVCVSIDGLPENTNAHRGKGAYETAVKALDIMSRAGINTRMHSVLTYTTSYADIDHVVGLAKKYNTYINFAYPVETGIKRIKKAGCGNERGLVDEEVKKICTYIYQLKKRSEPVISRAGAIRQVLNWPYNLQDILIENEIPETQKSKIKDFLIPRCLWGHLFCYFNPDERLYLCARGFDRDGFFVEINNRTIRKAFYELARLKPCYMCAQLGDLTYSLDLNIENILSWIKI